MQTSLLDLPFVAEVFAAGEKIGQASLTSGADFPGETHPGLRSSLAAYEIWRMKDDFACGLRFHRSFHKTRCLTRLQRAWVALAVVVSYWANSEEIVRRVLGPLCQCRTVRNTWSQVFGLPVESIEE
jgi:hypothetical protein